jgi:hypothetical protein
MTSSKNGKQAVADDLTQFSFRGPLELHREVHAAAAAESLSFAEFARRALWDAVQNPPSKTAERISEIEARLEHLEGVMRLLESAGVAPTG